MAKPYDENLILGYVEGDLPAEDRATVEAQLAADPQLAALVTGMTQDCIALRSLPREAPPADMVEDVLARVERGMLLGDPVEPIAVEPPAARRFRLSRVLAYSGLAALIAISGGLLTFSLVTGGLMEATLEHADVGSFFERGGRAADAQRPRDEERRLAAADAPAKTQETPAAEAREDAPAPAAQPSPAPATTMASAERATPAEPLNSAPREALPDMARSVEQMALDTPAVPRQSVPRFRRFQAPLVLRADQRAALDAGRALTVPADAQASTAVVPLRVKVLTSDPVRAKRDVERWAAANLAKVVEDVPAAATPGAEVAADMARVQLRASEVRPALAGGEPDREVVMIWVERARVPDLVQYLNRDGQEAGLVPVRATVCMRSKPDGGRYEPEDATRLIAQQVAAAHARDGQQEAARALTERLERLQRSVRERAPASSPHAGLAMAMQPATLAPTSPDASVAVSGETTLALAESEAPRGGLAGYDQWGLLFQYELPEPMLDAALPGGAPEPVTVPVIISGMR